MRLVTSRGHPDVHPTAVAELLTALGEYTEQVIAEAATSRPVIQPTRLRCCPTPISSRLATMPALPPGGGGGIAAEAVALQP